MEGEINGSDFMAEDFRLASLQAEDVDEEEIYLSLYHSCGKLGAAFYNVADAVLHIMNDLADPAPHYKLVPSLLAQLNPRHLLISSKHSETAMGEVARNQNDSSASSSWQESAFADAEFSSKLNETCQALNIHVLPTKNFALEACRRRVLSQALPGESSRQSVEDHHLTIHSMISVVNENMIRACGALLKYLDKHQVGGLNLECSGVPILDIQHFTPQDVVRVDETTLTALQIFSLKWQTSGANAGSWNQRREGLSIYSMLNRCNSVLGARHLRYMMRCLPRSLRIIENRQESVAYFSSPSQLIAKKSMQDAIKKIKSIGRFLKKLSLSQVSVQEWKGLKSTLINMVTLGQICANNKATCQSAPNIVHQIAEKGLSDIPSLVHGLESMFDSEESEERCRFVVKPGLDPGLDEKKRVHNGLSDLLFQLSQEEVESLPSYMDSCTMVYVPQIGYMLAVEPWPSMPSEEEIGLADFPDLKFMFCSNGTPHFKSKRCFELDETLGDTATNICDHETSIMLAFSSHILSKSSILLEFSHLVSQLDCLLSLATAASENDWCRPTMVDGDNVFSIKDGRHPLQEQCVESFVPNSTQMGGFDHKLLIMTGPNACGKSVYLKQVGIIAFLAHLGSWVPAISATIPILDGIFSRIQTVDSIALGLSAFAVDVSQMSTALNNATGQSLVLVDEFGKGTNDVDGQALMAACLEFWVKMGPDKCPFVLVSTHFHSVKVLLQDLEMYINYQTFSYEQNGDELLFLYKMRPGAVNYSEAENVARRAGIDDDIIARSKTILKCIAEGTPLTMGSGGGDYDYAKLESVCEEFINTELNEEELRKIFAKVLSLFEEQQEN